MQRRSFLLIGGVAGLALTALGGSIAWLYEPAWREGHLAPAGRRVLHAVARAVLSGALPEDPVATERALLSHLQRMEFTLNALPHATQREVDQLLAVLALAPGRRILMGLASEWTVATVEDVQRGLRRMRESKSAIRRQAYHALRDLTHAAYYADRSAWPLLGYPGPAAIR